MAVPVHKYQSLCEGELDELLGQIENQEKLGWELCLITPEIYGQTAPEMYGGDGEIGNIWRAVMRKQIQ